MASPGLELTATAQEARGSFSRVAAQGEGCARSGVQQSELPRLGGLWEPQLRCPAAPRDSKKEPPSYLPTLQEGGVAKGSVL